MIRHGSWQTALADVAACDAVISDPPYGARVHGFTVQRSDGHAADGLRPEYDAWTPADVAEFVDSWSPRCRGWMVSMTSHDLVPSWEKAYADVGRYCFAPIPCVMRGMSVRMLGDGPSNWTVWIIVARPRNKEFMHWGTLPGAYVGPSPDGASGGRGKPEWLLSALVRDYTRPGDLVVDPMCGWGSTLAAAIGNGRHALGAEVNADAFARAQKALARPQQLDLLAGAQR